MGVRELSTKYGNPAAMVSQSGNVVKNIGVGNQWAQSNRAASGIQPIRSLNPFFSGVKLIIEVWKWDKFGPVHILSSIRKNKNATNN